MTKIEIHQNIKRLKKKKAKIENDQHRFSKKKLTKKKIFHQKKITKIEIDQNIKRLKKKKAKIEDDQHRISKKRLAKERFLFKKFLLKT